MEIEERIDGFQSENPHFSMLRKWILNFSLELDLKEKQLNLAQKEVEDCNGVLKLKKEEVDAVQKEHEKCNNELTLKNKQLASVRIDLEKCSKDFNVKNDQLESVQKLLQVRCKELEVKEKEVESATFSSKNLNIDIEQKEKELTTKKEQLKSVLKETDLKHKELAEISNSISDCSSDLEAKQNRLNVLQGLTKELATELDSKTTQEGKIQDSIRQCKNELDLKKKELNATQRDLQECLKELEVKKKELTEVKGQIVESSNILSSKQNQCDALKTNLEERSTKLEMKEKQLEARVKEFEMKEQQQVDAMYQKQSRQALESLERNSHLQACGPDSTSINENTSPLIVLSDVDDPDLVSDEFLAELKSLKDPADFVLSLMKDTFSQQDINAVKDRTSLLEKLREVSPKISSLVKNDAFKLAVSWKQNLSLGTEKSAEVWSFLLFLAAFGVVRYFDGEEILRLLMVVAGQRHPCDICQELCFTDKIPDIIRILMKRKQHLDAARFICAFGLHHMFPLENILQKFVDNMKEKALVEELGALKAILQCIKDYKLESRYNPENTRHRIRELEMAMQCSRVSPLPLVRALGAQPPPQQSGHYRTVDLSSSKKQKLPTSSNQQLPHNQKFRDRMCLGDSNKRPRK